MTDPFDRPGTARPLVPQIAAMSEHAKLITYLEQENSVLHSKLRQLEIKLEKAEKALAVEREECARVAEDKILNGRGDWDSGYDAACEDIAEVIRARGGE